MGVRTIVLKLHKPSTRKQIILDEAISNYNKAYEYLLNRAELNLESIQESFGNNKGIYKAGPLSKWVDRELSKELNRFGAEPFKDSLKFELGMALAGYFMLKKAKGNASFPEVKAICGMDAAAIEDKRDGKLRPLYFCRYDTKRSYSLLYDREKDRFFAKLYLMNRAGAKAANTQDGRTGRLRYVHKDNGLLEQERKKETFLILPLSFGKYQEKFLKEALTDPKKLRTARLLKRGKDYYLSVSLETGITQNIETVTFLGVARGLKNQLNYTIINKEGRVLGSGVFPGRPDSGRTVRLNELHESANEIAEIALKNKSQVILQNLEVKGDRINWSDDRYTYKPIYNCRTYNHLARLLDYKLPETGLPGLVKVSSVDIFYRCHQCGFYSRGNRFTKDIFICTKCGATMETEELGSLNLARKLIRYSCSRIKIKVLKTPESVTFINKLIGLHFCISNDKNQLDGLEAEIERLIGDMKNRVKEAKGREKAQIASIIKKFESSEDVLKLIEFV